MEAIQNFLLQEASVEKLKNVPVDKILKSGVKNLKTCEKVLKDNGIDVKLIKKMGVQLGNKFSAALQSKKINDKTKPQEFAKILKPYVNKIKAYVEEKTTAEKIGGSIVILAVLVMLSSGIAGAVMAIVGQKVGMIIAILAVAPIMEEYAKRIALLSGYPWVYTGIFAGFEAVLYIAGGLASGVGAAALGSLVVGRLFAVGLHFMTTLIQKGYKEEEEEEAAARGEKPGEISFQGYWMGVIVHFCWNLLAVIGMLAKGDF